MTRIAEMMNHLQNDCRANRFLTSSLLVCASFIVPLGCSSGTENSVSPTNLGGATVVGGATNSGGASATRGGATVVGEPRGGATNVGVGGQNPNAGGNAPTGGANSSYGSTSTSAIGTGGNVAAGGSVASGGTSTTGGMRATGGTAAVGGATVTGVCDIYQIGNTPCVAAHSTARALYGAYSGNLYQVRRASDKTTKDIPVLAPGGFANSATQDTFCAGTTCSISVVYDQSPNKNDLTKAPPGGWLTNGGLEADAAKAKILLNGHAVYGIYTTSSFNDSVGAVGYRDNTTKGIPTGDQPEAMYMVVSGKHYNQWCCFDYGNAETNNKDNGPGTMEAVYFGSSSTQWGKGSGTGPWVMADLEDGIFGGKDFSADPNNTSLISDYVTAMLKGKAGGFALKGGNAQSGTLKTMYEGARPVNNSGRVADYNPMKKEGAIVLGVGGDNSHAGEGTFFEGCMVSGYPTDATDAAVQANIVAAGYGR